MKKYNIIFLLSATIITNVAYTQIISNKSIFEKDSVKKFSHYAVSSDELKLRSEVSVADALYGKLPGLMVMQGMPEYNIFERDAYLNYRGTSTLGSSSMLVLVDGFERDLTYLSIDEVDKVELLTNAVAQSMYGVRGANGVLLITTKRGRTGFNSKVSYSFGLDLPFRKPEFADAPTYANALNEALTNDGLGARYSPQEIRYMQMGIYPELYSNVDWQKEMYSDFGKTHQGSVQFDGGNDKFRYYTIVGYANQEAMFRPTNMDDRYNCQPNKLSLNMRVNLDVILTKSTLLKVNLFGKLQEQTRPTTGIGAIFSQLYNTPASAFPVKTSTGAWAANSVYKNPVADFASRGFTKPNRRTLYGDITIKQKLDIITKGLSASAIIGYDNTVNYQDVRTKSYSYEIVTPITDNSGNIIDVNRTINSVEGRLGFGSTMNSQNISNNLVGRVDYNTKIDSHKIEAGIVYEQSSSMNAGRNATRKRQSVMAVATYSFDDKYIAQGVASYSGTAVMPEADRFNLYPAISLSWIASKENFLKDVKFLNYLEVYGSAGLSGMDLFGHDLDKQLYGSGGDYYFTGASSNTFGGNKEIRLAMTDLAVEKSKKVNFGFNTSLFGKLQFSTELFYENRSQIMVPGATTITSAIGVAIPSLCVGKVKNKGIELSATWSDKIAGSSWGYHINGNFTYAKNKIVNSNEESRPYDYLRRTGGSLNQTWGYEHVGFFNDISEINDPATPKHTFSNVTVGDVRYKDQNDDGRIDANDMVRLGYGKLPEIYYGVNLGLTKGGFGIYAQFQGVAHRSVVLNESSIFNPLQNNTNISTWYLNDNVRWTPQSKESANLPRLSTLDNSNNNKTNTVWIKNGNYFKLRNVEVSYTIPKKFTKWIEARIWVAGSNLFSIDQIEYADPEMLSASYPVMQSFTFGANITF